MRVKCFAQEHNHYVPKSSTPIIRPPISHKIKQCIFSDLRRVKLTFGTTHLHSSPHGGKAEQVSQQNTLLHQRIELLRKISPFLGYTSRL